MMPQMNNPLALLTNGADPKRIVMQMATQDPRMRQITQLLGNKTPAQQRQYVTNFARERGLDLDGLARSLGISIPSNR